MTTVSALIKRHPVVAYFALTFTISWGGVLLVVGPSGLPVTPRQYEELVPIAIVAMLLGPPVAGILSAGLVHGRTGLRDLVSRLLRWRVGVRWYIVALLTAPLLMTAILIVLSFYVPELLPLIVTTDDKSSILIFGIIVGLAAGFFEEIGWTGFATPELRQRYGVLATGLIVGVLWATWHLLVAFWASGTVSGPLSLTSYLLDPFLFLMVFRVLIVWVYDRTQSLLVAMLMHASLTGSARILSPADPQATAGKTHLIYLLVWFGTLCVLVAAVYAANGGQFERRPS